MKKYQPIIGLEVHIELNTKSKMFCGCSADYFGKAPNTHTCPICLGLPGALPFINHEAINKCLMIGLALGCQVNKKSLFERKNYFYPDLPKGYQISQYRWPLCIGGRLEAGDTNIRINRVHQEEDTGKLIHIGNQTGVDFNRSGVPLVEIVTEPDFSDSTQVKEFAKKLQQLFRSVGVSNADMERGDMRLEANVSVRPEGKSDLPNYRVELKNINSFKFMGEAIDYEIERQIKALESGEKLTQETRGWDQEKKQTYLQRSKEEANDYRYFPEPDLPELRVKSEELRVKSEMPELPWDLESRLVNDYQINQAVAVTLINQGLDKLFLKTVNKSPAITPKDIANLLVNSTIKYTSPDQILTDLQTRRSNLITDETELKKIVEQVISENPDLVSIYKSGKVTVLQVFIGAVMKKSSGKADAGKVSKLLLESLK